MKTRLTAFLFLSSSALCALPVGNPAEPTFHKVGLFFARDCIVPTYCDRGLQWWYALSFRFGFYGDYVYNRHLKIDEAPTFSQIDKTTITTNAGQLILNIFDKCDLFWNLGSTQLSLETSSKDFVPGTNTRFFLLSSSDFSWSLGARGALWQRGCSVLGAEAQYLQAHPTISHISLGDAVSVYPEAKLHYQEWQVGVSFSHSFKWLVPYIGAKYARAKVSFVDSLLGPVTLLQLNARKNWGYCVGASVVSWQAASVTAEARFSDEKAFYINTQVRF